jgi:hypothetical protein
MKKLFQLLLVCGGLAVMNSCNNQDACEDTVCQNNGVCVEGTCVCPEGFSGPNCEIPSFDNGVYIVHEGNFQGGNASVSFLNKNNNIMSNGVFTAVNGIPLGDVGQSMTTHNGKGFIVVNNSGKIEVVSLEDFTSLGTIIGLTSPRYMTVVNATKAYVSDLFSGVITILNPETFTTSGTIAVNGQVEEMVVTSSGVIAAGTGSDQVYKINATTDAITDSVYVGIGPANVRVDANGKVWVLTNGGWGTEVAKLVRVNPTDMTVEATFNFPSTNNYPGNLQIDDTGTNVYFVDGAVFKMDVTSGSLPTTPFINAAAYKCGVDPADGTVYVSDGGDFNSNGKVYRFQSNGIPLDTFNVGVIPAEYAFTE